MTERSKIGFSSRYYEPFKILKGILSVDKLFKLVHNEDKGTYSFPFLYDNYKNEIEPKKASTEIIESLNKYLKDNLFREEETSFLWSELEPHIENFGQERIDKLISWIEPFKRQNGNKSLIIECEKTIEAIKEINSILNDELMNKPPMSNTNEPKVFISYSHDNEEHKDWVLQLATRLRSNGVDVILDRWNLKLGSDLASFMERGLSKSSRIISVCSSNYVKKANEGKGGAGYEKQIITAEFINDQNHNWVIPLIKNNSDTRKTPIFLGSRLYIDFEDPHYYESKYEDLLRDILDEPVLPIPPIGKNPFKNIKEFAQQKFIPSTEKYVSPAVKGTVTFDYSNNNGKYCIGQGEALFELAFSKSSNRNIQLYNDPASIRSVAIAKGIDEIAQIDDARIFDGSSRVRRPNINQIAVIQNSNGFFSAIKILSIKDDTRGAEFDEVTFEYVIQTNGSSNFK